MKPAYAGSDASSTAPKPEKLEAHSPVLPRVRENIIVDNLNPTLNIDSVTAGQCLAEAENPDKQFEGHALADLVLVIDRRTCQGIAGRVCPFAQGGNFRDKACCTLSQGPGKLCMLTGASRWKHPILPILFVLAWRERDSMRL